MKIKIAVHHVVLLLISAFILIFTGCDDFSLVEFLNHDISLIPSEITLAHNESVEFSVVAGIPPFTFTKSSVTIVNRIICLTMTVEFLTIFIWFQKNR